MPRRGWPSSASGSAPVPAPASAFVPIVEPFDRGHPARTVSAPASCNAASATLGIERCYDARTENADAAIDTVQLARYASDGFVVNPRQFYFQDKSFIDHGVIQPPDPTGHRVATGQEYQFGLDYSHLSADPNANKSAAAYLYAPGYPAALWS